ncbi:MAG: hypothetical protein JSU73_12475 [candidate division WOR-3 bacterium]|nr:MAG: hypothetical protein JSU73_12475 [candidate division WOR-3 bacterium]
MNVLLAVLMVGQTIEPVSAAVFSGADRKLVVVEDRLYTACERGLDIFDVAVPESIALLGRFDTPGYAYGCAVSDTFAYIADNYSGLIVVSVADPADPVYITTLAMSSIQEVVVRDTLAFCGSEDLKVVSIADPANPYVVGTASGVGVYRMALYDTLCLVATQQGLKVVSIADPAHPAVTQTVETGWLRDVQVQDDYAYACGDTELVVVDVKNLVTVGRYDAGYLSFALAVQDSIAVVCRGQQMNVHVLNVSNPASPVLRGTFSTQNGPQGAVMAGDWAYIGVWSRDLLAADVSDPGIPVVRGRVFRPGELNGAWRCGDLAVTADRWYGMSVVDVSDIENPVERGHVPLSGWPRRIMLVESLAYCAEYNGLAIVSVADPDNPEVLGLVSTTYYSYEVAVKDTLALIAEREWNPQHGNLVVVNVADPRHPQAIGWYATTGGGVEAVAWYGGDYAYVVSQGWSLNEFAIVNITDPTNPYRVSGCNTEGYPIGVDCAGDYAYALMTSPNPRILVISVADTLSPSVVGSVDLSFGPRALFISYPYLFVGYYYHGVEMFDITNPIQPVPVDRYNTTGTVHGMHVSGNYIYAADAHSLQILRLVGTGVVEDVPARRRQPVATSVCLDGVVLKCAVQGPVCLLDAAGRTVRRLVAEDGRLELVGLSAGVYHVVGTAGVQHRVVKVR